MMKKLMIFVLGLLVGWATLLPLKADGFRMEFSDRVWVRVFTACAFIGGATWPASRSIDAMKKLHEKGH